MALISEPSSNGPIVVDVHPFHIWVSRISGPNAWRSWEPDGRLKLLSIVKGSTFGGPSYAVLQVAVGQPFDDDDFYLEHVDALRTGDRVAIGNGPNNTIKWLFCGYCVQGQLEIRDGNEALVFRIAGPEWIWGAGPATGAYRPVYGQLRRESSADDDWAKNTSSTTSYDGVKFFDDEPAVFNPDGRRNMTTADVIVAETGTPQPKCRIWESPDRKIAGELVAGHWTMREAVKSLVMTYNETAITGIQAPEDWESLPDTVLPATVVDTLGLVEAVNKVMFPTYGFYVDPTPTKPPSGTSWGPFPLGFFAKGQGPETTLYLNELNTPMHEAVKCVSRLNVAKDASKIVNDVIVLGKALRSVKLQYHGTATKTISADQKKLALQHGWKTSEADLATFATSNVVDGVSIGSKTDEVRGNWFNRHVKSGKEYQKYAHVFRLFVWNEANEFSGTGPKYGTQAMDWFAPDLTGIADDTGFNDDPAEKWYRRRRPLMDTQYFQTSLDAWARVPVAVFIRAAGVNSDSVFTEWERLSPGQYRIDPERAAIYITVDDLSLWQPLIKQKDPEEPTLPESRTFATLLLTGKLRMMVEATIETDYAKSSAAPIQASSGIQVQRRAVIRNQRDFLKSLAFADSVDSPLGITASPVDTTAAASALATQVRAAGQDLQPHASILVELDWPEIAIGSIINRIDGRGNGIDLRGSETGVGAQVVAKVLDPEAMKWELLTQSAVMQLRDIDRSRIVNRRRVRGQPGFPVIDNREEPKDE